jgi:hypothetical protein
MNDTLTLIVPTACGFTEIEVKYTPPPGAQLGVLLEAARRRWKDRHLYVAPYYSDVRWAVWSFVSGWTSCVAQGLSEEEALQNAIHQANMRDFEAFVTKCQLAVDRARRQPRRLIE